MIKVGIDFDDTLCDFTEELNKYYNDLKPMLNSFKILNYLKETNKFEFYLITSRQNKLKELITEWINKHFPNIFSEIIFLFKNPNPIPNISLHISKRINNWEDLLVNPLFKPYIIEYLQNKLGLSENPILIGISGKIGSGKDTIGDFIINEFPMFNRGSFAYKLKEIVSVLTNTSIDSNMTREGKGIIPNGFTQSLGQLQQIVGEGFRNLIDNNVWVNCLLDDINLPKFCVITDCRYKTESNKILSKGGLLIRVNGDPKKIRENNFDKRNLEHSSETDLDDFPFENIINNNSSLEDLKLNLMKMVIPFLFSKTK